MPLLLVGRLFQGVSYEVVDTMTLPLTAPYFTDVWGKLSGIVNGFIRLGSVMQVKYDCNLEEWSL